MVVSGLARGIDTAAHDGALETGTIAVIAGGIDIVYPPENEARQRAIAERGLLVAEQPPGTEPRARHFPYRNRIIAGLAHGTVVVEAAPKSGSLITARLAAEYGREVMAVPGSPLDPRAQGCNQLIREGATLVQTRRGRAGGDPPARASARFREPRARLGARRRRPPTPTRRHARAVAGLLGADAGAGRRARSASPAWPPAIVQIGPARARAGRPAGAPRRREGQPGMRTADPSGRRGCGSFAVAGTLTGLIGR